MATNPYVNKVEFGNQTVMDLTGDTVEPSSVLVGETFHDRSGAPQTGTLSVDEFVTNDLLKDTVGWTGKNLLIQPYPKENTFPYGSNVIFTMNSDYTLTASGTTSSSSSYIVLSGRLDNEETLKLPKGKYVFSGNALNGSTYIQVYTTVNGSMYSIAATQNNYEVSFEITDELLVSGKDYCATGFLVGVVGNKTVTDVTFKPMVRHADVKNNTYEQYHENVNEELTTVKGDISDIEALIPSSASTSNKLATANDIPSLTNYVEKSQTAGLLKNDGTVDTTQYVSDISGKADKVTSATSGDFAGLDSNGNLTDSGISADIIPSGASSSNKLATANDIPTVATVATTGSYYDLVDEPQNETADAGSNTVSLCTRREKYIWNQAASNRIKIHTQTALAGATSVYIQIDSANDHIVSVNADDGNDTIIKFKTMVFYGGGGSTAPMLYLTFSALAYDTTFEVLTV